MTTEGKTAILKERESINRSDMCLYRLRDHAIELGLSNVGFPEKYAKH